MKLAWLVLSILTLSACGRPETAPPVATARPLAQAASAPEPARRPAASHDVVRVAGYDLATDAGILGITPPRDAVSPGLKAPQVDPANPDWVLPDDSGKGPVEVATRLPAEPARQGPRGLPDARSARIVEDLPAPSVPSGRIVEDLPPRQ
jgi:hypothetical protein